MHCFVKQLLSVLYADLFSCEFDVAATDAEIVFSQRISFWANLLVEMMAPRQYPIRYGR